MSHLFLSPEQLADAAYQRMYTGQSDKNFLYSDMIRYIEKYHYHIVAVDIQEACRRRIGL
jgi:hypothetical protein